MLQARHHRAEAARCQRSVLCEVFCCLHPCGLGFQPGRRGARRPREGPARDRGCLHLDTAPHPERILQTRRSAWRSQRRSALSSPRKYRIPQRPSHPRTRLPPRPCRRPPAGRSCCWRPRSSPAAAPRRRPRARRPRPGPAAPPHRAARTASCAASRGPSVGSSGAWSSPCYAPRAPRGAPSPCGPPAPVAPPRRPQRRRRPHLPPRRRGRGPRSTAPVSAPCSVLQR
mmetsp:Transcript_54982/g.170296  ORF Transcript_54982/g.170296 Transcript_54982/m.170296 type:complete len:228 (-) Transcript_54982:280-963(-)